MTVKDLESAIRKLPPRDLKEFRSWFEEFDADLWDSEFEDDAEGGNLDPLADQALTDLADGKCTEL